MKSIREEKRREEERRSKKIKEEKVSEERRWPGDGYDLLTNKCVCFAHHFAQLLGVSEPPKWCGRLPRGLAAAAAMPGCGVMVEDDGGSPRNSLYRVPSSVGSCETSLLETWRVGLLVRVVCYAIPFLCLVVSFGVYMSWHALPEVEPVLCFSNDLWLRRVEKWAR